MSTTTTPKTRPILFSGPMVRAILDGKKTQTRRVLKGIPPEFMGPECAPIVNGSQTLWAIAQSRLSPLRAGVWPADPKSAIACPHGNAKDQLWVRETACIAPKRFAPPDDTCVTDYDGDPRYVSYKADGHSEDAMRDYKLKWTPSILIPRWVSRITLEIESVRVERLNDISEEDAESEGCEPEFTGWCGVDQSTGAAIEAMSYVAGFKTLWESINGPGSWDANPWVWVISFRKL